jgi:excisionase family DNA binding protein
MAETVTRWESLPYLLTVAQVGTVMQLSRHTAYKFVHESGCPLLRLGKSIRVPREAFRQWLDAQEA